MKCALHYILLAYWVVLLIRVLSSWLPRPPTSGPGRAFLTLIYDLTDPVLGLDRFFAKDESYRDIGTALGLPSGTIASRISRCLSKLRSELEGRNP